MRFAPFFCLLTAPVLAQPYSIGNTTRTWFDVDRNREVTAELHYPADVAGDDVASATGAFPVVVVGHGFVMTVDAYDYLWQHFTPLGYIVILPTTEGGFAPDHAAFGADLAFAAAQMQSENTDALSLFFGHVATTSALMGHSMGGGAALLGANGNAGIQAVVDLAPAETNPSAITAAAGILVPTLLFAADEDCVTPVAANQQPMYDALSVECKALVNITGGGHCYFGDDNFLCTFGELTCGPDLAVSREQQHAVVTDFATLWLDHYLRGDGAAITAFQDSMSTTTRAVTQYNCLSTGVQEQLAPVLWCWPVPADDVLRIGDLPPGATIEVLDMSGQRHPVNRSASSCLSVGSLSPGTYRAVVTSSAMRRVLPFVIMR